MLKVDQQKRAGASPMWDEDLFEKLDQFLPGFFYKYHETVGGRRWLSWHSPGMADVYGITPEQAAHNDFAALWDIIHPDDRDDILASVRRSAETLTEWEAEYRIAHPRKGMIWIHGRSMPERISADETAWYGFIQDITRIKSTLAEVGEARFRAKLAQESLGAGIWDYDPLAGTLRWDTEMFDLYRIDPRLFTGRLSDWFAYLHPDDVPAARAALERLTQQGSCGAVRFRLHPDLGPERWLQSTGKAVRDAAGTVIRVVGLNYDITADVQTQIKERRLSDEANQLRLQAEEANRAKSRFLAMMSHELRTPLNAMIGFAETMSEEVFGPLPARYADYAEKIGQAGRHLLSVIGPIIDLHRLDGGKVQAQPVPVDLAAELATCTDMLVFQLRETGAEVRIAPDPAPVPMHFDPDHLRQILINLIRNAIEAGAQTITLSALPGPHGPQVRIADDGPGIPIVHQHSLWQPFTRAGDEPMQSRSDGMGLGLPISVRLAALNKHSLDLTRSDADGTVFSLRPDAAAANGADGTAR
ncbi:hypothetical protein CCR85_03410 [Rhodothalassium salexigens]|nr:hypothetical protein [Rhodothalassium salexigens]